MELLLETISRFAYTVTPAKAGVQNSAKNLDSGFRRNDTQRRLSHLGRVSWTAYPYDVRSQASRTILLVKRTWSGHGTILYHNDFVNNFNLIDPPIGLIPAKDGALPLASNPKLFIISCRIERTAMTLGLTAKHESPGSSFPHAPRLKPAGTSFSGNPDSLKSLDPRQKHAGVTG